MSEEVPASRETGADGIALTVGAIAPYLALAGLYLTTVLAGLSLADEAAAAGLVAFQDPGHVGNVGVFAVYVLAFTAVLVAAFRYGRGEQLIRLVFVVLVGGLFGTAVVLVTGVGSVATGHSLLAGLPTSPVPVAIGAAVAGILWVHPEWYVTDVVVVVMGAVVIPMFGLSFGPLPIVVLLVAWAAYDAFSVYGSGHMKDVANGAMSLKLPLFFVVPTRRGFSLSDLDGVEPTDGGGESADGSPEGTEAGTEDEGARNGDGEDLGAMLLGLGDAIIPGMLAVSAGHFLDAPAVVPALNANAPAIGALLGGIAGLGALLFLVHRTDGVHAGLPPLNAGVLAGYLLGAVAAGIPLSTAVGL